MAYNHQTRAIVPARVYCLMPGDGTVYRFGFFEPWKIQDRITIETDRSTEVINGNFAPKQVGQQMVDTPLYNILSGVGDGTDYVYIWIDTNDFGGVMTWMLKWSIENLDHHILRECEHRFGTTNIYTLTAILLAVKVLLKNPTDVMGACKKALEAPAILSDYNDFYLENKEKQNGEEE